jgi:Family of unknown function (DUF6325)
MSLSEAQAPVDIDEMGPVDFLVVEFPHRVTPGEGVPLFVDLVDRGVIRVLDLAFIRKDDQGKVQKLNLADLGPELAVFEGASANLLDNEDLESAGEAISPDSTGFVLVYENRWAAPLARAMRRGGGQLVATGRIPVQGILAALDAADSAAT